MTVIFIRTFIIFVALVIVMRLMGKRQIGEMQPFEFIVTLIIADLACVPMADVSIPLVYGLVAVFTLFILHQLLSLLERSGDVAKRIISGKPSIVINKDGVDFKELKKKNMDVEDLIESMRAAGYFSLDDVDYAPFESNGKLSAFESCSKSEKGSSLPVLIVNEGKTVERNLPVIKTEKPELNEFLKTNGATEKSVEVMTVDGNGRVYLKEKNEKFRILQFPLGEGVKW